MTTGGNTPTPRGWTVQSAKEAIRAGQVWLVKGGSVYGHTPRMLQSERDLGDWHLFTKGTTVLVLSEDGPEWVYGYLGIWVLTAEEEKKVFIEASALLDETWFERVI